MAPGNDSLSEDPRFNWKAVDITGEVIEVIKSSLSEARSVISGGGTWLPLVHILHADGMESMRISGMSADPAQRNQVANLIDSRMNELKGIMAIMITDNWISPERPGQAQPRSLQSPFPGRAEALTVAMWGHDKIAICGMQMYKRFDGGNVIFEEFEWEEPAARSICRLARGNHG